LLFLIIVSLLALPILAQNTGFGGALAENKIITLHKGEVYRFRISRFSSLPPTVGSMCAIVGIGIVGLTMEVRDCYIQSDVSIV